ncbi:MAG: (Fe-S)-binding protein [Caldisericota bacterium]|nr:(Fe-S)-binding protein [Caldisericota bacterium]
MKKQLNRLIECSMCPNMCKFSCPVYLATGNEAFTPQKKARLILYSKKDLLEDKDGFFDTIFQCALCGSCVVNCQYVDFDIRDFIANERNIAFEKGFVPSLVGEVLENFNRFGNPSGERETIDKGEGEIGFFVSCNTFKDKNILSATEKILNQAHVDVKEFGGGDICCGAPLFFAGDMDGFKEKAEQMEKLIKEKGVKRIITNCPTCIKIMKKHYAEVGVDIGVDIVHVLTFTKELIDDGKLSLKKVENKSITYHDPCILAKDLDILETPRAILKNIGYSLLEPAYTEKDAHCCGGKTKVGDGNTRDAISSMRENELKATKAPEYVSACPTCKDVLKSLQMKDIVEIIGDALE